MAAQMQDNGQRDSCDLVWRRFDPNAAAGWTLTRTAWSGPGWRRTVAGELDGGELRHGHDGNCWTRAHREPRVFMDINEAMMVVEGGALPAGVEGCT
jgi:hypothetical protein